MGKYVESNLGKNESIVKKADRNSIFLVWTWIKGILFCWLLLIPLIKAITATIRFTHVELAITNKRVLGKVGVFHTQTLDVALNKVQNVMTAQTFFGKLFNYGTVTISSAAGEIAFGAIKNVDAFKGAVMAQIDQFEEDRMQQQADLMAKSMASVINK